jgi:[acyl-carrier-protein] S-malonyltransferase
MYAFIFPGQGSQRAGMGQAWQETPWWSLVEQLSEVSGRDLGHLLTGAGADELKSTGNAQLATFTLSLMILAAARSTLGGDRHTLGGDRHTLGGDRHTLGGDRHTLGGDRHTLGGNGPVAVAGHSLGEYTAMVAAGVLLPDDGVRLVAERGEAMAAAAAASPGTMAAVIGLEPEAVARACQGVASAWVANDNAPGQIVVAGTASGVDQAAARARELGAKKVMPLAVSGAFHTPLMARAQDRLDAALQAAPFGPGQIACVANVDAAPHCGAAPWRRLLSDQLCSPVRWRESLLQLADLGVTTFVELGPGAELSGMVKRTLAGATRTRVAVPDDLAKLPATVDHGG